MTTFLCSFLISLHFTAKMENRRGFWLQVLLLLVAQSSALSLDEQLYFVVGGKLLLNPPVLDSIASVVRKHNFNLVAEWHKLQHLQRAL